MCVPSVKDMLSGTVFNPRSSILLLTFVVEFAIDMSWLVAYTNPVPTAASYFPYSLLSRSLRLRFEILKNLENDSSTQVTMKP